MGAKAEAASHAPAWIEAALGSVATCSHSGSRHCSEKSMAWGGLFLSFSRPSQEQQKSCLAAAGGFNYDTPLHGASRPISAKIAYVTDGNGSNSSGHGKGGVFAFGSGTLQGHLLAGEERFSVQLDEDDQVWYEVMSFSKPAHILSSLCYPYVQLRQRHFAHQSGQALLRHVASRSKGTR